MQGGCNKNDKRKCFEKYNKICNPLHHYKADTKPISLN